jgi:hypothetical protein
MNVRYETGSWIEKLQQPAFQLDILFFRYPILFGLLVGSISCVLIVISIINLLR